MGFPDYTKDFKPINIHIRSVQDTESFVTGKNKAVDVLPFTGPDLIFSSNSSDIVFNHKFYTRIRSIDLADSNTTGFSSYTKPDNVENLDGKVVLAINQENTGEKNIWIRSILEKDIPSYLPNTRVGRSDGLSHKINLFGNITDLYVNDKDLKAGKTLVFDKLSGIKDIDAENISVSKNAVLLNTFTRQLVVSNNPDPNTYKTDDWHLIITDNEGKSDPAIDLKNIVLSTNKSIEIDEKNSYRDPSFTIFNNGQSVERNPKRKEDIKPGDLEYFEGTARLAQLLESPIHLKVFSNDPTLKGQDGKPLVTMAGEVYLNGPDEATQSTGELPYFNLDLKNSYLFSSIVDNPNKNEEVVTRPKDKETTKEGARQFVKGISRKSDTTTAIQSDYDYIKFDDITERPSTLDGYGITDGVTKDDFNTAVDDLKKADEDVKKDVDKGFFKLVADNAINALNKYELLRVNIEKLSNLYTNENFTADSDILKSDTTGLAVIDEDIHGEFKNTVFKKCTTLKETLDKTLADYEKDGSLKVTRSTESAFVNKRHNSTGSSNVEYSVITDITPSSDTEKLLDAEKLMSLNNLISDLLSECEHTQNELFTVLHLDTKRQLQYDIFNREPDPEDYIPGSARPLIDSFFDYTTAEVADDEDLKKEKLLLEFNNKGTDKHVITVESSVDLKGNFMDYDDINSQYSGTPDPGYTYEVIGRSRELFDRYHIEVSDVKDHNGRKRTTITIKCDTNYNYIDPDSGSFMYDLNSEILKRQNEKELSGHIIRYADGPNSVSYLKLILNYSGTTLLIPLVVLAPDHLGGFDAAAETLYDSEFYSPNLSGGTAEEELILYILPDGTILPSQLSDNRLSDDPIERIPNAIEDTFYNYEGDLINPYNNTKSAFDNFVKAPKQKRVIAEPIDKTAISIVSKTGYYGNNDDNWEVEKIEHINQLFAVGSYQESEPLVIKESYNKLRLNLNLTNVQNGLYNAKYDRLIYHHEYPEHWLLNSISSKISPILGSKYDKNTFFNVSFLSNFNVWDNEHDVANGHINKQVFDSNFVYDLDSPKSGVINAISKFVPPTESPMSGKLLNDITCYPVCNVTLKLGGGNGPENKRIKFTIKYINGMVYKFAHATRPYAVETRSTELILNDLNSEEYKPLWTENPNVSGHFAVKPLRRKDTKSKLIEKVLDYGSHEGGYFTGGYSSGEYPKPDAGGKFTHKLLRTKNSSWRAQALSTLPTTNDVETYDFNTSLASAEGTRLFDSLFGRTVCGFNVTPPEDKRPFDIIIDLYTNGLKLMPRSVYKNDNIKDLADKIIDYKKLDIILNRSQCENNGLIDNLVNWNDKDELREKIITNTINKFKDAKFYYDVSSTEDDDLTNTKKLSYETITAPRLNDNYSDFSNWKPYMISPVIKRLKDQDDIAPDSDAEKTDEIPGVSVRFFRRGQNEKTGKFEFIEDLGLEYLSQITHLICVITVDPTKLRAKEFTKTDAYGKEYKSSFCGFKLCLLAYNSDLYYGDGGLFDIFKPSLDNKVAYRNLPGLEFYFPSITKV